MAASAFAFYRGTAALMAADLAAGPSSGIQVASCGDAHVANFGFYASPQRTLVFDLNDFDEAAWAPWEWDVKRLAVSAVLMAADRGWSTDTQQELARSVGAAYRFSMNDFAAKGRLSVWYSRLTDEEILALLDRAAVTFQAVLTKADKILPKEREKVLDQVRGALSKHPAAYPEIVVTSSEKGEGIETLRAIIATMA